MYQKYHSLYCINNWRMIRTRLLRCIHNVWPWGVACSFDCRISFWRHWWRWGSRRVFQRRTFWATWILSTLTSLEVLRIGRGRGWLTSVGFGRMCPFSSFFLQLKELLVLLNKPLVIISYLRFEFTILIIFIDFFLQNRSKDLETLVGFVEQNK